MPSTKKISDADSRHGVQAAETVLQVLSGFIGAEPMPMLKTLAERIGMHPAKVHRYLVSLSRMGYVEQDSESSRYRLGPHSLRLGFAAMATVDVIRVARPMMHGFCQALKHTAVLAIWTDSGPTVALVDSPPGPIVLKAAEGSVLTIFRSSIGRTFAAWLPRTKTSELISTELKQLRAQPLEGCPTSIQEAEALFQEIRKRGLARVAGQFSAGLHSLSAPVFNSASELVGVLCVLGPSSEFDSTWSGPTAKGLVEAASSLSAGLGHSSVI